MMERNIAASHCLTDLWIDRHFDQQSINDVDSETFCSLNTQTSLVTDEGVSVINYRKYHGECSYKDQFCFSDTEIEDKECKTNEVSSPSWPGRFLSLVQNFKTRQKDDLNSQRSINKQLSWRSSSTSSLTNLSSNDNDNLNLLSSKKSSCNLLRSFSFGSSNRRLSREISMTEVNEDLLEDWPR